MSHENSSTPAQANSTPSKEREQDAIYQNGRPVARVLGAEVDLEAKEIRFEEVYNSDSLFLPDECEFQQYRIMIQRMAYASEVTKQELHKGRILRGVSADLLGFREQ